MNDEKLIPISEIFGVVCQGEGSLAGAPTVFVRVGGCDYHCVHPDTMVTMSDFTQKPISEIVINDSILGIDHTPPNRQRLVTQKVLYTATTEPKRCVEVNGLICSHDHEIWSSRRHGYVQAENVGGSFGRRISSLNSQITDDYVKGYLRGAIYGDGWFGIGGGREYCSFEVKDEPFIDRVVELASLLGIPLNKRITNRKSGRQYFRFVTKQKGLRSLLKEPFDFDNEEWFRGFCGGFFDAEGSWGRNGVQIWQTKDKWLMEAVCSGLNEQAFFPQLKSRENSIYGSGVVHCVNIPSTKKSLEFVLWSNSALRRKWRINNNLPSSRGLLVVNDSLYTGPLFDITTETGNFFGNGLLVHNCSWCDTMFAVDKKEYGHTWTKMSCNEIFDRIMVLTKDKPILVTLSGGNPALFALGPLLDLGHRYGYTFACETQGSVSQDWFSELDYLTLSPKPPSSGEETNWDKLGKCLEVGGVRLDVDEHIFASLPADCNPVNAIFKVVVSDEDDYLYARNVHERFPLIPFYISVCSETVGTTPYLRAKIAEKYDEILTWIKRDQWYDCRLGFQQHTMIYGNVRGV